MRTKVQKWGNSLALRIPKPFADEVGLQPDTAVEVSLEKGKLVVSRSRSSPIRLEELLQGITPGNLHREVDSGKPVGNEAW
jgi:antitoxin MazE